MLKRTEKYAKKISGIISKERYEATKELAVKLETAASMDFEQIEKRIKSMVQGCPAVYLPYYIIFGKEIYSKQKKFKGQTLLNELAILDDKWFRRGLDEELLIKIKTFYVPTYPVICYFRLDISELDGPCVLA